MPFFAITVTYCYFTEQGGSPVITYSSEPINVRLAIKLTFDNKKGGI